MAKKAKKVAEAAKDTIPAELVPIVERMRKAEADAAIAENDEARGCGIEWAKNHATPRELHRLEGRASELTAINRDNGPVGLLSIITGQRADWDDAREFFNTHVGETRQDEWEAPGFVQAFADGALAMWGEVKAHVQAA